MGKLFGRRERIEATAVQPEQVVDVVGLILSTYGPQAPVSRYGMSSTLGQMVEGERQYCKAENASGEARVVYALDALREAGTPLLPAHQAILDANKSKPE